ncbi:MAG: alpha/beta hydrolase, partial [Nocardioidaceae bacterium]|nr:alpha/beta hydrolase [Nocardioidaceae bacterium]
DLVDRQVLIGANFHNDGVILDGLDGLDGLDEGDDAMRLMGAGYAQRSPDGPEHFPVVYEKFMRLARTEPTLTTSDLATIRTPTLVLAGDDDMITLDHTLALYDALPESQLAIVPGSSHAVPLERPALVASLILDFLAGPVPPRTFLPVRRAVGGGR